MDWSLPVVIVIALTGLVWGFGWFNDAVHWITSGEQRRHAFAEPASHRSAAFTGSPNQAADTAWDRLSKRHPDAETLTVFFPATAQDPIRYLVNPDRRTCYKTDHYYVDQYSLRAPNETGLYEVVILSEAKNLRHSRRDPSLRSG